MQPWTEALQDIALGLAIVGAVAGALLAVTWPIAKDLTDRKDD